MTGNVLLWSALFFTILAMFFLAKPRVATALVWVQTALCVSLCAFLLVAILAGWYDISYVYRYSSSNMTLVYKVCSLWAGKGGSLILWLTITSVTTLAMFLKKTVERSSMLTLLIFQGFILVGVLGSGTFMPVSPTPADGMGMNPLLESVWMVSHPPFVFGAYALVGVLFALTVAYGFRPGQQAHEIWRRRVVPIALAAWGLLGLGIVLGAFWAYETLGWGGYWGWDPVENASLIPWLFLSVTVHSLLVDEAQDGNARAAFGGIFATFCGMILAIFITRSGVLSQASVHAYAGSSMLIFLLVTLVGSIVFSFFMYYRARKFIPHGVNSSITARPFSISIGNIAVTIFSLAVVVGSLWPALKTSITLDNVFYQAVLVPVMFILCFACTVAPVMAWKVTNPRVIVRALIWPMLFGMLFILYVVEAGLAHPLMVALGFFAAFMIMTNLSLLAKFKPIRWGAFISHIGVGVLVLGVLGSSIFQGNESVTLKPGEASKQVLDFSTSLVSFEKTNDGANYQAGYLLTFKNKRYEGTINGRWWEQAKTYIAMPAIHRSFMRDVVISPDELKESIEFKLAKGATVTQGDYTATIPDTKDGALEIRMTRSGDNWMGIFAIQGGTLVDKSPLNGISAMLVSFENGVATVEFKDLRPGGTLSMTLNIAVKYWMTLVWLGMIILLIGAFWAFYRRLGKKQHFEEAIETPVAVNPKIEAALP